MSQFVTKIRSQVSLRTLPFWCFVLTFPIVAFGSYLSMTTFENDFARWPLGEARVRQDYDWFQATFESTDLLIVSWVGCQLDDLRLHAVRREIRSGSIRGFVQNVWDGESVYQHLTQGLDLTHVRSVHRLKGSFLGPDEKQTCLYLALNRDGTKNRYAVLDGLAEILQKQGVSCKDVRLAGPAFNMHNVDVEGFWSPLRAVPFIALLSFILTWLFIGQFGMAVFVSAMSCYTGALALSIVYLSGINLNTLVWTMPTLVLLLTTSAALHYLGYHRQAISTTTNGEKASGLAKAWRPIFYCAGTTAVGLFSLMFSNMAPVREFGAFGGISVLLSAAVVLGSLPVWLSWFPLCQSTKTDGQFWYILAGFTRRFRWPIILVVLASGTYLLLRVPDLQTSAHISNFFPASSRVVTDSQWFDENLAPSSTVEVVLTFTDAMEKNDISRLRLIEYLHRKYVAMKEVKGAISAATYSPIWRKKRKNIMGVLRQNALAAKVASIKRELVDAKLVSIDSENGTESWRISLRVDESNCQISSEFIERLEKIATERFSDAEPKYFPGEKMNVMGTGQTVLLDYVESQFLRDLIMTFATAFILISLVIFLIMRSLTCVFVATPPNLIPAALVLGSVASMGLFLDVGSLMTASVALGIAVDDTLHFFLWWRERVRAGLSSHEAIVDAMKHCGVAMFQTTVVCGVSIALYAYCGFLPTVRFGLLLSGMLFAALVGDLLLLPALLSTRIGRMAGALV